MGFRENLKDELKYQGMLVKELADKSGVPKGTIDHYLAEKCTAPTAESAVKIARALNVSVEYLVTGKRDGGGENVLSAEFKRVAYEFLRLSARDRELLLSLARKMNEIPNLKS